MNKKQIKQQKIRSLTWKYFWQQKCKEVKDVFIGFCSGYLYVGWIFALMFLGIMSDSSAIEEFGDIGNWVYAPLALWLVLFAVVIIGAFISWIIENWKKAKKRATKEVKK